MYANSCDAGIFFFILNTCGKYHVSKMCLIIIIVPIIVALTQLKTTIAMEEW